ncbi:hypothetical protein NKR19_g8019 [Coniochaeta hoffmannii]|uniref:Uncharacterized protein n=1 Tax=Coniochaeta hoffmannii TaxID=91930 RepID=A0AA38R875_9PEZI|nr:hypothetical protein NKR19_g8019 [Coniochaeta hoffmannii]
MEPGLSETARERDDGPTEDLPVSGLLWLKLRSVPPPDAGRPVVADALVELARSAHGEKLLDMRKSCKGWRAAAAAAVADDNE